MDREPRHEPGGASDQDLVERFQRGTDAEGAFRELFRRYAPLTDAFFRRRIGNDGVAAEQNQELFVAVLEHLDRFRGESSFRTWLFRMARNRLFQLRRRWRVHLDEVPDEMPRSLADELAAGPELHPEREASRNEQLRALRRCLAGLSEVERAVVFGQYYHGVSLRELTEQLRLDNPSGARASLIAAQRSLRRCLRSLGVVSAEPGGKGDVA